MNKELEKQANGYVADLGVAYVKTHNLHWNVTGLQFKAVHEYLESLYDAYADSMDVMAELIRQQGGIPVASMAQFAASSQIEDVPAREWSAVEAIEMALADMKSLRKRALAVRAAAADQDFTIVSAVEDQVAEYDKQIWFMESMLK